MIKKYITYLFLTIGFVWTIFPEQETRLEKACKINFLETNDRYDNKHGVASTTYINGVSVYELLHNHKEMDSKDLSIVQQLRDGTFSKETKWDGFGQATIAAIYKDMSHNKRKRSLLYNNKQDFTLVEPITYPFQLRDDVYVPLTEGLVRETCSLCEYSNGKQVIIADTQGTAQEVCEKYIVTMQQREEQKKQEEMVKIVLEEIIKIELEKTARIKRVTENYNPHKKWKP